MKILLDLQGAQTSGSRNRGIGRYSLSFAEGVIRNRGAHDIHILLNGAFRDSFRDIYDRLGALIPSGNFHVFEPLSPTRQAERPNLSRRAASELIREATIGRIEADVVHVTSHFEGFIDDAVTSLGRLASNAVSSVTLYDLIPHIHRQIYLPHGNLRDWYDERLVQLRRADLLLSISASSGQEAIEFLRFPPEQVVNVRTAADTQFHEGKMTPGRRNYLINKYVIRPKFIMYTGGIDYRKNIKRLISAYASIPNDVRSATSLAVICSCTDSERKMLEDFSLEKGLSSEDFVMTGFVPDADLVDLYRLAHHFVFPSWHEGFGLPALEAMSCGAPVIAGDCSSLPEVIGRPDALFDPMDESTIAALMTRVLTQAAFRKDLAHSAKIQARQFSWDNTAKAAIKAFEKALDRKRAGIETGGEPKVAKLPRLAYVSPLPPARSGIADYSFEVIVQLSRYYDIDVIIQQGHDFLKEMDTALLSIVRVITPTKFLIQNGVYDRVMYHFGNSDHHGHMLELIRMAPGIIVLHDFYLGGLLALMQHVHGVASVLDEAIYESHGYGALAELKKNPNIQEALWKYPCNLNVIRRSLGVVVHSNHALDLARDWYGDAMASRWRMVPLMRLPHPAGDRKAARASLGIGSDDFVICSFGGLGETKLSDKLVKAFALADCAKSNKVHLILVGAYYLNSSFGRELESEITSHPFAGRIHVTGWVERDQYQGYLAASDVAVQLRTFSRGETSAAALDCLNWGIATIINAHGSMTDIPGDCAFKLKDKFKIQDLSDALDFLFNDPKERETYARNGRDLIRTQHDPARCADAYRDALEHFYATAQFHSAMVAAKIGRTCGDDLSEEVLGMAALQVDGMEEPGIPQHVVIDSGEVLNSGRNSDEVLAEIGSLIHHAEDGGRSAVLVQRCETGGWMTRHDLALEALVLPTDLLEEHRVAPSSDELLAVPSWPPNLVD